MSKRVPFKQFILDRLISGEYPNLRWVDKKKGIFELLVMNSRNKDYPKSWDNIYSEYEKWKKKGPKEGRLKDGLRANLRIKESFHCLEDKKNEKMVLQFNHETKRGNDKNASSTSKEQHVGRKGMQSTDCPFSTGYTGNIPSTLTSKKPQVYSVETQTDFSGSTESVASTSNVLSSVQVHAETCVIIYGSAPTGNEAITDVDSPHLPEQEQIDQSALSMCSPESSCVPNSSGNQGSTESVASTSNVLSSVQVHAKTCVIIYGSAPTGNEAIMDVDSPHLPVQEQIDQSALSIYSPGNSCVPNSSGNQDRQAENQLRTNPGFTPTDLRPITTEPMDESSSENGQVSCIIRKVTSEFQLNGRQGVVHILLDKDTNKRHLTWDAVLQRKDDSFNNQMAYLISEIFKHPPRELNFFWPDRENHAVNYYQAGNLYLTDTHFTLGLQCAKSEVTVCNITGISPLIKMYNQVCEIETLENIFLDNEYRMTGEVTTIPPNTYFILVARGRGLLEVTGKCVECDFPRSLAVEDSPMLPASDTGLVPPLSPSFDSDELYSSLPPGWEDLCSSISFETTSADSLPAISDERSSTHRHGLGLEEILDTLQTQSQN